MANNDVRGESLPLAAQQRIDEVCVRFENAWATGAVPRIEDSLGDWAGAEREELLRQLLRVELDCRLKLGQRPTAADYRERFPGHDALIEAEVQARVAREPLARPLSGEPAVPGYQIVGKLGHGGMGVVYEALQVRAGRRVALKVIRGEGDPEEVARFRGEAEAAARLQHPNVVQIFEVGEVDGRPFFSMELCEGGSLDDYLRSGPLPSADAAALVQTLAAAMQHAHEAKIIHRDLKPGNVLLCPQKRAEAETAADPSLPRLPMAQLVAKVGDFGLARKLDATSQTQTGAVLGTPSYLAPEQAEVKKDVGPAADVYGLGAILYECLTGRPPFQAATWVDTLVQVRTAAPAPLRLLNSQIPRPLEVICLKCLEKQPEKRYVSAQEFADDLGRFQAGKPIKARPPSAVELMFAWFRSNYQATLLLALVGVLGGLMVAAPSWLEEQLRRAATRDFYARNFPNESAPPPLVSVQDAKEVSWVILLWPFVGTLGTGFLAVLAVRSSGRAGDLAAGVTAGLVLFVTALTVSGGADLTGALGFWEVKADLECLAEPGRDGAKLVQRHGDLKAVASAERGTVLAAKVRHDLPVALAGAVRLSVLVGAAFLLLTVLVALYAGRMRREFEPGRRNLAYLCLGVIAGKVIVEVLCPPVAAFLPWLVVLWCILALLGLVGRLIWETPGLRAIWSGSLSILRPLDPSNPYGTWRLALWVVGVLLLPVFLMLLPARVFGVGLVLAVLLAALMDGEEYRPPSGSLEIRWHLDFAFIRIRLRDLLFVRLGPVVLLYGRGAFSLTFFHLTFPVLPGEQPSWRPREFHRGKSIVVPNLVHDLVPGTNLTVPGFHPVDKG